MIENIGSYEPVLFHIQSPGLIYIICSLKYDDTIKKYCICKEYTFKRSFLRNLGRIKEAGSMRRTLNKIVSMNMTKLGRIRPPSLIHSSTGSLIH